jgi:hypothetical protein
LEKIMMVVHMDWLATGQGTARDKRPYGGSSWSVITVRTEPWERKASLIIDVTSTDFGKEEMAVHL